MKRSFYHEEPYCGQPVFDNDMPDYEHAIEEPDIRDTRDTDEIKLCGIHWPRVFFSIVALGLISYLISRIL